MEFNPSLYGPDVERALALDGNGNRLMPLRCGPCSSKEAHSFLKTLKPAELFPGAEEPEAPMAGLWLYFSCFEEAHELANYCETEEGYLWHAIIHRQECDFGNAAYWFRKAGRHPVYRLLAPEVSKITHKHPRVDFRVGRWDPFAFLSFCDRVRHQPGTLQQRIALQIQRVEWQILFDYCARPPQL
jgi:hypothetical protein